jgi:tRNA pseudouridine55 synthase
MDGVLVIDKPIGPTSHDVVARVRRALGEPRIGHTGTLDPDASGVLPLVLGRATRLARFLSASDKSYDAIVRLGVSTDTGDAQGRALGPEHTGHLPGGDEIAAALDPFRGRFFQQPPVYSAKKIDGRRSYRLARAAARRAGASSSEVRDTEHVDDGGPSVRPAPVAVTAHSIDILSLDGDRLGLRIHCSAGFYVRSLAHDLGERLGTGAHLAALRRTRSAGYELTDAISIDSIEQDRGAAAAGFVPLASMLPRLPCLMLTAEGTRRAKHGRDLGPADLLSAPARQTDESGAALQSPPQEEEWFRLLTPEGDLVGLARPSACSGALHPSVVLI